MKRGKREVRLENETDNQNKSKRKVTARRVLLIILTVLLSIIAIFGCVFGVYVYKNDGSITKALLDVTSDVLSTDEPIFVLLLGISEDISTELTDTIILCAYNPESQKAFMLSIPRDTFVGTNPEYASGFDKINARYQYGVKKTVEAVRSLTGINVENYVIVRTSAIPNLVSAVGSVEFDVPIDMNYDDPTQNLHIHLKKGVQLIDKDKAEQLLRFRHNNDGTSYSNAYGDNDYGRMKTQKDFIKAIVDNLTTNGNMTILKNAASFAMGNVETNMSLTKIMGYLPKGLEFDADDLKSDMISVKSAMLNELFFFIANANTNRNTVEGLLEYLELDSKEMKKYYNASQIKPTVSVPERSYVNQIMEDNVNNTVNNVVNNTVNNVVNNTVNNTVNNVVNNTIDNSVTNTINEGNTIPEHVHDYTDFVETVAPTCTADGYDVYKCPADGETTKIPNGNSALGHDPIFDKTVDPTCTASGYDLYKCSRCGNETKENITSALGHNYEGGVCTRCGNPEPVVEPVPEEPVG